MKKILLFLFIIFCLSGCSEDNFDKTLKTFETLENNVSKLQQYSFEIPYYNYSEEVKDQDNLIVEDIDEVITFEKGVANICNENQCVQIENLDPFQLTQAENIMKQIDPVIHDESNMIDYNVESNTAFYYVNQDDIETKIEINNDEQYIIINQIEGDEDIEYEIHNLGGK